MREATRESTDGDTLPMNTPGLENANAYGEGTVPVYRRLLEQILA